MDITSKSAVVTGASSGIGRACAFELAVRGASVLVVDVDEMGGEETVRQITEAGGTASFAAADVSTGAGIRSMLEEAAHRYGPVDILHNNAGIVSGEPAWPDLSEERITLMIDLNIGGVILGTYHGLHAMRGRGGVIINTASIEALMPMPMDPVYAASKAAVWRFTQSCGMLALSEKIRINAVLPGGVRTPILNKTGDGTQPAAWLKTVLDAGGDAMFLDPEDIAAEVIAMVEDDGRAGECKVVSKIPIEAFIGVT